MEGVREGEVIGPLGVAEPNGGASQRSMDQEESNGEHPREDVRNPDADTRKDGAFNLMKARSDLLKFGKELGLTGVELANYVKEELENEREDALRREEREREDALRREEREREEREKERDFQLRKLEMEQLANQNMNNNAARAASSENHQQFTPKIPYLTDEDKDPESFLRQFELYARDLGLDESKKASRIIYFLKGKARTIVAKMSDEDIASYDKIKAALLEGFQLNAEQYRIKFRTSRRETGETHKQYVTRLQRYQHKWFELDLCDKTVEGFKDLILREQLLRNLPNDLAVFIKDKKPQNAQDVGEWATDYEMNRNHGRSVPSSHGDKKDPKFGKKGGKDKDPPEAKSTDPNLKEKKPADNAERDRLRQGGLCFYCKEGRHMSRDCPKRPSRNNAVLSEEKDEDESWLFNIATLCNECENKKFVRQTKVLVENEKTDALRDTGCDDICVSKKLVNESLLTGKYKIVKYAKQELSEKCPVAVVNIDSPYFKGKTEAIVIENPICSVLIGNRYGMEGDKRDTPVFPSRQPAWYEKPDEIEINQVETRAEKKRQEAYKRNIQINNAKREEVWNISPEELRKRQKEDPSLEKIRKAADTGIMKHGKTIVWRNDILYQSSLDKKGEEKLVVVVPKSLRYKILSFAHDHAFAGHLCTKKTTEKIRREFWWPSCAAEIKRYCLSCDICQRSTPKPRSFPLGSMPIFVTPFKQVAIDIIGPIEPMSENKNRYILTMIDYATRYPEAVALKNIRTETIADALFTLWTRLGIPEQLLSDNASNFTGKLMEEVLEILKIKHRVTAVYNPRSNGACERANGQIKQMIRKMCNEQPKKWDQVLDALLFAYREAPHESTGFSPFEMLFGRTVRGPMQLLRQIWTDEEVTEDVKMTAEYVVNLREKLEETCKIAKENLRKSAKKQAKWYNRKTKARFLKKGDQVLVLIPGKRNALQLGWQGPYEVMEVINRFDYRIKIGNTSRIFHINLLKEYKDRKENATQSCMLVNEENADKTSKIGGHKDEETQGLKDVSSNVNEETQSLEDVVSYVAVVIEEEMKEDREMYSENPPELPTLQTHQTENEENVNYSDDLNPEQLEEVKRIVKKRARICTDVPLTTNLMDIGIQVTEKNPVFVRQRPIPHAMVKPFEEEIDNMLKLGVIEPACSPYNANIVMVKKKNGDYRFCQDLRQLNDVVVFDGEPLTDVEHLFFKLGEANFFSKIDLCKGYWGIQIREEDRDKTAFATSKGQFRWVNMPFGLKTAAGAFNRMMRKLLSPLNKDWIHHFMDDILIATKTWEEHLTALDQVLQRLDEANLAAKPSKMFVGFRELPYLGHMVGSGKRWPENEKIEKILRTPKPSTKKEVKSLLGQASFYREYIPDYSTVIAPLSDLTRKGYPEKVVWTQETTNSFEKLRKLLSSEPVLRIPDNNKEYVLRTDASGRGLGAVLLQEHNGKLHPVAYQSRKLLGAETRYATVEKECLATVWAIRKFERYLYGRKFILETDHKPLLCLQRNPTNPRLLRWSLQLQPYQFSFKYIKGQDNIGADYLSRVL